MKAYRSLKSALTLNLVIMAVLPAVVIGFIALKILSNSMEKEITVRNELLAKSLAAELDRFLKHPLSVLKEIKEMTEKSEIVSQDTMNDYLADLSATYEFFKMIRVLNSKGIVTHLAPSDENILGLDMSNQEYYRVTQETNEPQWSQTFLSPRDGKPTLTLTLPLRHGMLVGDLKLSVLNDVIDRVRIGSHGYAAITDNDGTTIAHRNRTFVSERLNVKNLNLIKKGLAGNEGPFKYYFRGEEKIGSVAIVPKTRWLVLVVQTTAEAFAPINRLKNFIWVSISIAILIAIIVALGSLRKVLGPLLQITEDSKRIAEGDYAYTPAPRSYTEIVNLGNSFKTMIDAVKVRKEALLKSQEDFRSLAGKLLSVQESERRRLAREMHDDLSQRIAVLAIDIGKIERHYKDMEDPVVESLQSVRERLVKLSGDIHSISRQLHPSILDDLGLVDAIKSECSSFAHREGIAVDYQTENIPPRVPPDVAIVIYRIGQEALRNVAKHARTNKVQVSLSGKDDSICLTIKDQGAGFDPKDAESKLGLGIVSMQERVRLIRGNISIESQSGQGTVINVQAPL